MDYRNRNALWSFMEVAWALQILWIRSDGHWNMEALVDPLVIKRSYNMLETNFTAVTAKKPNKAIEEISLVKR